MKVVGYLRVSTDHQAERGLGLDVQEQAVREWVRSHSHRLAGIERDEGISGSNGLDDRVGLVAAFSALQEGKAKGLVVYRLDRLARDLVLQEQLLVEIRRLGGELFSTSAAEAGFLSDDPDDPSRALIRQVLGAVAQYERSMISMRLRAGRRRKAERGGFAYGSPPLGWRAVDGELVRDDDEQAVVARIAELRAQGASLRQIAAALTEEGLRPKRGEVWHPYAVSKVVKRLDE